MVTWASPDKISAYWILSKTRYCAFQVITLWQIALWLSRQRPIHLQPLISHINNESGNSCCDTAAWDAHYLLQISLSRKLCVQYSDIKSQLSRLDLTLNYKTEEKDEDKDWLNKTTEEGDTTRECLYLLCLGQDRLIAAADKGVLVPLYWAIWPGPMTVAPLSAF